MAAPIRSNLSKQLFGILRRHSSQSGLSTEQNFLSCQRRCLTIGSKNVFGRISTRVGVFGTVGIALAGAVAIGGLSRNSLRVQASTSDKVQSRPVRVPGVDHGLKLTLYQFSSCPFCCKLRAVLDYYGFSYDIVEVNSVTKKQIKWSDYKKVPILVVEDVGEKGYLPLNESSVIVSFLRSYLLDKSQNVEKLSTYYPAVTGKDEKGKITTDYPSRYHLMYQEHLTDGRSENIRNEERKWRSWTDADLVHMISPNVYRTPRESLETFYHFDKTADWDQNFSKFERLMVIYIGASVMYFVGKMIKRKYGLQDDVRLSLYDRCQVWMKSVGKKPFHGGDKPDLADLSVYGVLTSMEGCTAFNDALQNTKIGPWFYRVKEACQNHVGVTEVR